MVLTDSLDGKRKKKKNASSGGEQQQPAEEHFVCVEGGIQPKFPIASEVIIQLKLLTAALGREEHGGAKGTKGVSDRVRCVRTVLHGNGCFIAHCHVPAEWSEAVDNGNLISVHLHLQEASGRIWQLHGGNVDIIKRDSTEEQ